MKVNNPLPLGSMGLVYFPTWMVDFHGKSCVYIYIYLETYNSHNGSYGLYSHEKPSIPKPGACFHPHPQRKALDDVELNRQSQAVCERLLRSKLLTKATRKSDGFLDIPPKTNMEPKNAQLEKVKTSTNHLFLGSKLVFGGVSFFWGGRRRNWAVGNSWSIVCMYTCIFQEVLNGW